MAYIYIYTHTHTFIYEYIYICMYTYIHAFHNRHLSSIYNIDLFMHCYNCTQIYVLYVYGYPARYLVWITT